MRIIPLTIPHCSTARNGFHQVKSVVSVPTAQSQMSYWGHVTQGIYSAPYSEYAPYSHTSQSVIHIVVTMNLSLWIMSMSRSVHENV